MTAKVIRLRSDARPSGEASAAELVAQSARHESGALAALFDCYHRDVYRFLSRLARTNQSDIDDLVQDTFLEVQRSAGRFEGRSQVRSWIFGIAANVARHHARSDLRRRLFGQRFAEVPVPPVAHPDQAAIRRQRVMCLERALGSLSHNQRVAFLLCELEGLSGAEAASALSVPEGTLFRRLHDARKKLRDALRESFP
jgi:RNA polymerase sigma-70 factor (ECF subfamily)